MFHPQPTSTLMLHPDSQARMRRHEGPGLLLNLLVSLRELRNPTSASASTASDGAAVLPVRPVHADNQSARVRSGLGGRMKRVRRRHGTRAQRRRGDLHPHDRRADRRGL